VHKVGFYYIVIPKMTQPFPLVVQTTWGKTERYARCGGNKSLHTSSSVRTRHCEYCYYYYYYYYY
jgi:hypothetical protein